MPEQAAYHLSSSKTWQNEGEKATSCGQKYGRLAYILLWFPLASETFVFREVTDLALAGADIRVFSLYGLKKRDQSAAMQHTTLPITRLGCRALAKILRAFGRQCYQRPRLVLQLCKDLLFKKLRSLESQAENTFAFFAGFLLAEYLREWQETTPLVLHAPWATGPATAALVAATLCDLPFSFTGRAVDIYPEDGLLTQKIAAAAFVRTNNQANSLYLQRYCPSQQTKKIHVVYNGLTLPQADEQRHSCHTPLKLLAVGRFVPKKGFALLLTALARLRRERIQVQLTLLGDGALRSSLECLVKELGLTELVSMPGFTPHEQVIAALRSHDILVVPSIISQDGNRDGIPNVIMEALSCAVPVIASDVCGIKEVITPETGFLVPSNDAKALAKQIRFVQEHYDLALQRAHQGALFVRNTFDNQQNCQHLLTLFAQAACMHTASSVSPSPKKVEI